MLPFGRKNLRGRLVVIDPVQPRNLAAGIDLEVELRRERTAQRADRFVADFLNFAGALREVDFLKLAIRC